jgi:hypothetical protein
LGLYALTAISIHVNNFNLGAVCLVFLGLLAMGFYGEEEPFFYVWVHHTPAQRFLLQKIKIAFFYHLLLAAPLLLVLSIAFPAQIAIVFALQMLGFLYLVFALLLKYANFERNNTLLSAILIGICLVMPPMLLFFLPFLFVKAKRTLANILP